MVIYHPESPCVQPGVNPDAWFPDRHVSDKYAETLCKGCPILLECRAYRKKHRLGGVWGGKYYAHNRGSRPQKNNDDDDILALL